MPEQPASYSSPTPEDLRFPRRPFLGFGLLAASMISALALLIYLGAWASAGQIENRALAAGVPVSSVQGEWWEDGLLFACPLH